MEKQRNDNNHNRGNEKGTYLILSNDINKENIGNDVEGFR